MENEAMNNVVEMVNEGYETMTPINCQSNEGRSLGMVLTGVLAVGTIAGAIIFKKRKQIRQRIDEKRIKKLEKRGYIISQIVEDENQEDCEE